MDSNHTSNVGFHTSKNYERLFIVFDTSLLYFQTTNYQVQFLENTKHSLKKKDDQLI